MDVEVLIKKTLLNGVVDNENKYITNAFHCGKDGGRCLAEYPAKENDLVMILLCRVSRD